MEHQLNQNQTIQSQQDQNLTIQNQRDQNQPTGKCNFSNIMDYRLDLKLEGSPFIHHYNVLRIWSYHS